MSKTVLIVDDSSTVREVVATTLKCAGYEVLEGSNGINALSQLTGQKVHLIISDLIMPVMDGLEFALEVKKLPNYRFTPIIMLSTAPSDTIINVSREAGIKAWMEKPLKPYQLLHAASKLLQA